MYYTASYDTGSSLSSSWRPGNLYLTNKRFLFVQITRILFQILLSQISGITIVKRSWILGKKVKQLFISYETDHGRRSSYIAVRNPEQWKEVAEDLAEGAGPPYAATDFGFRISDFGSEDGATGAEEQRSRGGEPVPSALRDDGRSGAFRSAESDSCERMDPKPKERPRTETVRKKIDEASMKQLMEGLDPVSCEILWYLWENRHARINELAEVVQAPIHMEVLLRIRERINPIAEHIVGSPVLSFERSRVDPQTGEKVSFSWWIAGEVEEQGSREREMLLDVFDEGAHITVLMELLGVREEDIRSEVAGDRLIVSADTPDRRYYEEIPLPESARVDPFTQTFKNGILHVKLTKERTAER